MRDHLGSVLVVHKGMSVEPLRMRGLLRRFLDRLERGACRPLYQRLKGTLGGVVAYASMMQGRETLITVGWIGVYL